MSNARRCAACGVEYDWAGAVTGSGTFCCAACSRGESCVCAREHPGEIEPELENAGAGPIHPPTNVP